MKKPNKDEQQSELTQLNQDLRERLSQVPPDKNREQLYKGIDEEADKPKAKKKISPARVVTGILIGVFCVLLVCAGTFMFLRASGKKSLLASNDFDVTAPELDGESISVEENGDLVIYNGQKYCYNHNIVTVLLMGVDQSQDERLKHQEEGLLIGNGQADTVILAAVDVESGDVSLMNISRDSMVDVDVYTSSGNFGGSKKMQVCLAYGYGKGETGGSENVARSISRLFYGIPVNSYAAINLTAIPVLNDAIGGVEVEVLEDLSIVDPALQQGKRVTLKGKQAEIYVRSRDAYSGDADSNSKRMERQKQYLSSFAGKTLAMTKQDVSVPLTLFDVASEFMVTDLNVAKVSYLVSVLNKVGLEESSFITVPGQAIVGSEGYAEYHVDDKALYEMILNVFYKKVNN